MGGLERGQKKQKSEGIASHVGIKLKEIPLHVLSASHLSARLRFFWVETPEQKSNCFPEKVKLICQQCKTVLVQANEYKER